MKRDIDLVRSLLMKVEEGSGPSMTDFVDENDKAERERYGYHVKILIDAGFLTGLDATTFDGSDWLDLQLSWRGQEFLDTLRDQTVWDKTKAVTAKAGGASFQIMLDVGKAIIIETAKGLLKSRL